MILLISKATIKKQYKSLFSSTERPDFLEDSWEETSSCSSYFHGSYRARDLLDTADALDPTVDDEETAWGDRSDQLPATYSECP